MNENLLKRRPIRINLGCGKDYKKEWINVDAVKDFGVDLVVDLSKKFPFSDNYADEILASDILEHFTKEKGELFLRECYRVLKLNGSLIIRTHNIFQIFNQFKKDSQVLIHFLYGDTSKTSDFGSHKYAYTEESIAKILKKIGFKEIFLKKETTNFLISAKKGVLNEKKLNIGVIQQSPDIGGAETYMALLIENIKNKSNIFFASDNKTFINMVKKNVSRNYTIPFRLDIIGNKKGLLKSMVFFLPAIVYYFYLLSVFKKRKVDVILMSGFSEKMLVTFLSPFFNIPVVWIEYGPLETIFSKNYKLPKIVYGFMNKIPKSVIVPANNTKLDLMKNGKVSLAKIAVIPCGVEIKKKKMRKESLVVDGKEKFVIGNVSRLTLEKGQQYLIMAMKVIRKEIPDVRLILVGDGPDREKFESLAKKEKLEDRIIFTGFVDNLDKYYSKMDIFVFPTVWNLEGFGLVMAEAMGRKIPVIASNIGPVPEVLGNNSGVLVEPGNSKAIAKEVLNLYTNEKLRVEIGQRGFERARSEYNIFINSGKVMEMLKEAVL